MPRQAGSRRSCRTLGTTNANRMPKVPTSLHCAFEFHDSEVSLVEVSGGELVVRFSAACIHVSEGLPGVNHGSVYAQAVQLSVVGPEVSGTLSGCLGKVSEGELSIEGQPRSMVPVPFEYTGRVALAIVFANGSAFTAVGSAVRVLRHGEARFVEHFRC